VSIGPGVARPTGQAALAAALRLIDTWPVEHAAAAVIGTDGVIARHGETSREFALASLTKPVVSTAILVAVEEGVVTLDDAVDDRGATLRHLLAHAAGYPFDGRTPVAAPGTRRIYSNTGIELAAGLVETASGMSFATYVHEAVIAPLGLGVELRGSPAHGAHGSVDGFVAFAGELLRPALLDLATATDMRTVQYPALDGVVPAVGSFRPCPWGLGVEIKGAKHPHWTGDACSPATFGHFGGAGTFCWVDPAVDLALVAFTDRSFIEWRDEAMRLWPALGDAVLGTIGAVAPGGDRT
jgi:CubicO group peptidase (beta-lactamase class C family)